MSLRRLNKDSTLVTKPRAQHVTDCNRSAIIDPSYLEKETLQIKNIDTLPHAVFVLSPFSLHNVLYATRKLLQSAP